MLSKKEVGLSFLQWQVGYSEKWWLSWPRGLLPSDSHALANTFCREGRLVQIFPVLITSHLVSGHLLLLVLPLKNSCSNCKMGQSKNVVYEGSKSGLKSPRDLLKPPCSNNPSNAYLLGNKLHGDTYCQEYGNTCSLHYAKLQFSFPVSLVLQIIRIILAS